MDTFRDLLQHPQHRGVKRIVKVGNSRIGAVYGQNVLYQVVGSDRNEVGLTGENISHQCSTRYFYHRPERYIFIERNTLFPELILTFFQQLAYLAQFGNAGDHRDHHPEVPVSAGSQDPPKLRFKQGDLP